MESYPTFGRMLGYKHQSFLCFTLVFLLAMPWYTQTQASSSNPRWLKILFSLTFHKPLSLKCTVTSIIHVDCATAPFLLPLSQLIVRYVGNKLCKHRKLWEKLGKDSLHKTVAAKGWNWNFIGICKHSTSTHVHTQTQEALLFILLSVRICMIALTQVRQCNFEETEQRTPCCLL